MKKTLFTLITFLSLSVLGQDIIYNFNTDTEAFTQGGVPGLSHNANGYITTGPANAISGGFPQIRTPEGLNISETNYRIVRIVVENTTNTTSWELMNLQPGSTSGGTAGTTSVTIATGPGFKTYDIPIAAKTTTPNGIIDRIALRALEGSTFPWNTGELKIAQLVILDTEDWISNADFETSTNWSANGPDVTSGFTTSGTRVGAQAATLTFNQNATGNINYLVNDTHDFGKTVSPTDINTTFYVKSTRAGINVQVRLQYYDAIGGFVGSGFTGQYTIAAANTWYAVTLNRPGITASFNQIQLSFRIHDSGVDGQAGDVITFDQVTSSYATFTTSNSWTGSTNTNWSTMANWTNGVVPSATENADVQVSANNPIISSTTGASVNNLTVNSGASLTINAGGSLIVNGTSTGNVTYNRTLNFVSGNTNGWHLVSSPVAGEVFDNTYATANSIAANGGNLGVASYTTLGNSWAYLQSPSGSISSNPGLGYSMKRSATGTVAFTGTINTADVNGVTVSTDDNGFNLLGNPYTSYMSSETFLNANTNTTGQIWTWTEGGGYTARTAIENFIIAPGQGFFVSVTGGSTVNFAESNQSSGTDNFQKSNKTEINLAINNGKLNTSAKLMYFDSNVTKGFDWGYEGKTFTAFDNQVEIYTHLLENNVGDKYQVQSLPKNDMEALVIPLGVKANAGEITFTAETLNLPFGMHVYLEDRLLNTFTKLDEANAKYTVTLESALDGIGRFYLHTTSAQVLSTDTIALAGVSMYQTSKNNLTVSGLTQGKASLSIFNIQGKEVFTSSFQASNLSTILLPQLSTGIYIAKLSSEKGNINQKIILE